MHAAMLATLLYNVNRPANVQPLERDDFMLIDRDTYEERASASLVAGLKKLAASTPPAMKGKKRRRQPTVLR